MVVLGIGIGFFGGILLMHLLATARIWRSSACAGTPAAITLRAYPQRESWGEVPRATLGAVRVASLRNFAPARRRMSSLDAATVDALHAKANMLKIR